jgi:prepilin-type N-terminal cleavage/methylation domain-containing protein
MTQKGFTIIELMIATIVFSVIILLSSVMITNIGNLYNKAINQSRIQSTVRSLISDTTQQLKLSSGQFTVPSVPLTPSSGNPIYGYCIGSVRYSYILGIKIGTIPHVLWRDVNNSQGSCVPVDISVGNLVNNNTGVELMAPNSRLTAFSITANSKSGGSPYSVVIDVAYGDDDLLCDTSQPNSCTSTSTLRIKYPNNPPNITVACKSGNISGRQFCAVAGLNVLVNQRVY